MGQVEVSGEGAEGALSVEERQALAKRLMALSGFDGVNPSPRRGWVYWPAKDPDREVGSGTRGELLRRARWLCANHGLARRIVGGLADLIGYLTPMAATSDEEWNEAVEAHYRDRAMAPGVFDAAGKVGAAQYQLHLLRTAMQEGDVLPVLIRQSTGGLAVATFESHQIGEVAGSESEEWREGVRTSRLRRHLGYRVIEADGESARSIDARDALYFGWWDSGNLNRRRPVSVLAHAVNHLIDVTELTADTKHAVKMAAQVGLLFTSGLETPAGGKAAAELMDFLSQRSEAVTDGDGQASEAEVTRAQIFGSGKIQGLPPGMKAEILHDDRPHPNQMLLIEHLVRDIAWGVGVSPEVLWNIEKLKGANNRLVNADLQRWIGARQLALRSWMRRWWVAWVAAEMAAGRLPQCKDPRFWHVEFLPQGSITADRGREGKLCIELVKNQMMTLADWYAEGGHDWLTKLRQVAKERKAMRELDLSLADVASAGGSPADDMEEAIRRVREEGED